MDVLIARLKNDPYNKINDCFLYEISEPTDVSKQDRTRSPSPEPVDDEGILIVANLLSFKHLLDALLSILSFYWK